MFTRPSVMILSFQLFQSMSYDELMQYLNEIGCLAVKHVHDGSELTQVALGGGRGS